MSDVNPKHIHNFQVFLEALTNGDFVLLTCTDTNTGKPVTAGCVISGTDKPGETIAIPVLRMIDDEPGARVTLPNNLSEVFAEHMKLKVAALAMAGVGDAEPDAEPDGRSLH